MVTLHSTAYSTRNIEEIKPITRNMGNFSLLLLCFIALHFLLNSSHKSVAYKLSRSSDHFHVVEVSSLFTASTCSPSAKVSSEEESLKLVHKYGPCSPRKHGKANPPHPRKILEQEQKRVSFRASRQLYGNNDIQIKWDDINTGEYIVNVGLGTPKRELTLVMDTGSSLLWTQCQPCQIGSSRGCYKQRHPIFDPSKSSTYSNITCPSNTCTLAGFVLGPSECVSSTCVYHTGYVDGSEVNGFLARESISVGSNTFNDIIFGCNEVGVNMSLPDIDGIIGLGQDFLSFVEQTANTYAKVFSYCLPSKPSEIGFLKFGKAKQVSQSLKFTKLGQGYAIDLIGIKLGNTTIPLTANKGDASIDSGSVISWIPSKDYINLREAYRKAMSQYQLMEPLNDVLDTCYLVDGQQKIQFPKMSFLFADGLVLDIPPSGVALPINSTVVCLPFGAVQGGEDMVLFGNTQQKTLEIVYDVAGGKLGFGFGGCS